MSSKIADRWFAAFGSGHQHSVNAVISGICVSVIFFCLLGLVWAIPVSLRWEARFGWFNWSLVAIAAVFLFYLCLSVVLAIGMLAFMAACHIGLSQIDFTAPWPVWQVCLVLLAVAGAGLLLGRRLERQPLPWLPELLFLLAGPGWLLSLLCRKCGLKY